MKQLTIILLGLIGIAYGQSAPTSAKTRFVNGVYLGTKLDAYFAAADSNAIYWRADSALMAKYKGTARRIVFSGELGAYIPYSDTTTLFSQVVRTFGTQTLGGNKTFSNDIVVNGATIGRRISRNIVFGNSALLNNVSVANTAIGDSSLLSNTSGNSNTAIGMFSLQNNTTGTWNDAIGVQSLLNNTTGTLNTGLGNRTLLYNTTGSRNIAIGYAAGETAVSGINSVSDKSIYIGFATKPLGSSQTNQIVIGDSAIGNGSNTVTIGNSSVTNNYFSGNIRSSNGTAFLKNIAVGSSSDSVLVTNNGEVRRVLQSSIGSGAYLPLSGGILIGNLAINKTSPNIDLNATASNSNILFRRTGTEEARIEADGSSGGSLYLKYGASATTGLTLNSTALTSTVPINGTSLSMSGGANLATSSGNVLIGTTTNAEGAKFKVNDGYIFLKESGGADTYFRSAFDGTNAAIQVTGNADIDFATNNIRRASVNKDGTFLINTTTTDGVNKLIVNGGVSTGAITASSSVTATQYMLSALNTAPSSASDTGTLGEVRIDANYIYVCTATNTWKRAAIATW